jgi:NaMN:DMB phosphoribosyltransferase
VVREGVGAGGEMNQALYAHMNNKRKRKKNKVYNPFVYSMLKEL